MTLPLQIAAAVLLSSLVLTGCRDLGEPNRRQAPGSMPGDGPGLDVEGAPGPDTTARTVEVTLSRLPSQTTGAVAFIGFEPSHVEGPWARLGQAPSHHAVSDPIELSTHFELKVELVGGLTYLAILDLDDDGRPGIGEMTSAPLKVEADGGPISVLIDQPYVPPKGQGGTSVAAVQAPGLPSAPGDPRELIVDTTIKPPFLKKGRILVVGLPAAGDKPFRGPLSVEPEFFWASDTVRLDWPVRVQGQVPAKGDVLVVLDLDGGGAPSLGDLTTEPLLNFRPSAAGEPLRVTLTGPLTDDVGEDD